MFIFSQLSNGSETKIRGLKTKSSHLFTVIDIKRDFPLRGGAVNVIIMCK